MKTVKLATFIENPDNPQTVTAEDFALLVESLRTMPQTLAASKIAYVTDYTAVDGADLRGQRVVIAGNKRLRALKQLAADHATSADGSIKFDGPLPAEWFYDLTPLGPDARRHWLLESNIWRGEWDAEKLLAQFSREELADHFDDDALAEILEAAEKDEAKDGETDADAVPDAPEKPVSRRGEVYICGEHRLMCGDSTSAADVTRLMDGEKADMVFTDPPYGMNLDTDYSSMQGFGQGGKYDAGHVDDFTPDMVQAILNFNVKETFIWGADYFAEQIPDRNNGSFIVWDKRANEGGTIEQEESSDKMFGSCFELCWSKAKHKRDIARVKWAGMFGMNKITDAKRVHPTQKPVALVDWFFNHYGKKGDIVADVFGGSGSTMIACEQLGRKCYMMELDAHYCDVIRKRWAEFVHGEGCDWQALTPCAAKGGETNRTPETTKTTGAMPQLNGEPMRSGFVPSVASVTSVPSNQP